MTKVKRWEQQVEIPLLFMAAAFLVAYAWPVIDSGLNPDLRTFLEVVSWTVWVAFAADFAVRILLAKEDRRGYTLRHWYDLALSRYRCCARCVPCVCLPSPGF